MISHLAKNHNVTLVTFFQGHHLPKDHIHAIESLGVDLHIVPLNPIKAGLSSIGSLFNRLPLEIAYYTQNNFRQVLDELYKHKKFDLSFSFFMRTAEYVKNAKHKKILVSEDCRTLYQQRSYEESNRWLQKIVRLWDYKKLRAYEPNITRQFDIVTLVTKEDIEAMKQLNPDANYRLLTNGVDINKFVPPIDNTHRHGIIFTGKLDLWANILMIETIVKRILPAIREEVPGCVFTIVGAKPTQAVISLARYNKNVRLVTEVPEMYPYLQNAEIFIHPHSSGSGIQNKLLEAMACGCPVVTTTTGNQGIYARDGIEAMIGANIDEIIEKSILILKDKELSRNIAANARELIVNTHSWPMVFDALDGIISELQF